MFAMLGEFYHKTENMSLDIIMPLSGKVDITYIIRRRLSLVTAMKIGQ